MRPLDKKVAGLVLALVQLVIVVSLYGKLLWDRGHYPHIWVKTMNYDPSLFIRGRYMSLSVEVPLVDWTPKPSRMPGMENQFGGNVRLEIRNGELVAIPDDDGLQNAWTITHLVKLDQPKKDCVPVTWDANSCLQDYQPVLDEKGRLVVQCSPPSLYFLPENASDPTPRAPEKAELWMDATILPHGIPRPIQLGSKKDGKITPVAIQ